MSVSKLHILEDLAGMWDDEDPSAHEPFRLDLDNDGQDELVWDDTMYGAFVIDAGDGQLYILAMGNGTAVRCFYTFADGEAWFVTGDTSHAGRECYYFKKYNGNGEVVDEFDLSAEYWEELEGCRRIKSKRKYSLASYGISICLGWYASRCQRT